jgi:hypothetical protein
MTQLKNSVFPILVEFQRLFVLSVASLLINGCGHLSVVALGPKPDDGPPFISRVEMERFKSERATREQVQEHFGGSRIQDVKESYYCYTRAQTKTRAVLGLAVFLVPFPDLIGDDVTYFQFVAFQFDSEGHVFDVKERWEKVMERGRETEPHIDQLWCNAWLKKENTGTERSGTDKER